MQPGLTKTFIAAAAITKRRIVKFDAVDGQVLTAAAANDSLLGVSDMSADVTSGSRVEVRLNGVAEVEAGGTIARGAPVTSDATGRAVAAAPAAGVNNRIIGIAMASYVVGDVADVFLSQGSLQG
ncbi:capsid cement protein [Caulobacter henricii]|uniref:DUF2190 domain-containing protein n=1 Tax=Caulobacter henricii TaxID=69395 RepID=A0A0P0P1A2_9CAUL|nr:capsid cement protein [Caulobacter henricii]ALL14268.1 hypothetical protein AQ619_13460 [Caulobacter henricii]